MVIFDQIATIIYPVIMHRGTNVKAMNDLLFAFSKLDHLLKKSTTRYFHSSESYQMPDLYGFPHVSRIFYLQGSALSGMYDLYQFDNKFPHLYGWFKNLKEHPDF
jgi:glutathione S-transferase